MSEINIDELCEPIKVTVGGKKYTLDDIPQTTVRKMVKLGKTADDIEAAIKDASDRLTLAKVDDVPEAIKEIDNELKNLMEKAEKDDSTDKLTAIMAEILGAEKGAFKDLGMRKLTMLVKSVMGTITEELEAKNVPEVAAKK